ncbi:hypothetical protein [Hufsiella ginkgonis]|uniref:Scaffolding protein n=1 Tax=Hufsiella ginkgonis TaxID=2695274 RepID=A0A7K1Y181_9SPHI|nr:hypothetical protein [Hufsiella ginkgonis]MXV16838.1 hypothetical protein [Hufsiella ginkgonis]
MKDKVLAFLKLKYKGKGLSNTYLEALAARIDAKITEESEIEGQVAELDDLIQDAAKEGDRRATLALKAPKKEPAQETTEEGSATKPVAEDPDMPSWAKALVKSVEGLGTVVTGIVKEKQTLTIKSQLEAKLKEKQIPAALLKGRVPEKEEDIDTVLQEIEADWSELKGSGVVSNPLGGLGQPPAGSGGNNSGDAKVNPDVVAFAKKQAEAATKKTA